MVDLAGWANTSPDKIALTFPETGATVSYSELDARARRVSQWLIGLGLQAGDVVAYMLDNGPVIFELAFGARRAGLYYTPLNTHLREAELAYVLRDSGARLLVVDAAYTDLARQIAVDAPDLRIVVNGGAGDDAYDRALAQNPPSSEAQGRPVGRDFMYSSGTTGFPKGIRKPLTPFEDRHAEDREVATWRRAFGFDTESIYLSPAPLYHASPLRYCMRTLQIGGSCVVLRKFDAALALACIERFKITHSQWVPIMFVRLLDLPDEIRGRHDLSSMRYAIHAAAPCSVAVKERMLAWWGERIWEFYGGSEGIGLTLLSSAEWRAHKGSVGRATLGEIHVLDEDGHEVPAGEMGKVFFANGPKFAYHNDPEKTRSAHNDKGWATYGDIGHVDADGFLFLSGRRVDLIISGGVNIYPQEIEDCLAEHPAVQDVAVVGVPNREFGEEVKAVVQLRDPQAGSEALAAALIAHCRARLPGFKTPRSVEFDAQLPRQENGKLLKRQIKERYWSVSAEPAPEPVA